MKEIGGYFELDRAWGEEYHKGAIALNSGRHCLEYLIKARNIKKIYLPVFLCSTVKETCEKCNCKYEYYNINETFEPMFEGEINENECIYIVNFYGQISNEQVIDYKSKYKNIIFDNAQAFFQQNVIDIDTLYTCRKFFGVSDGGYLYTDCLLKEELEIDKSYERIHFVLGRFERSAAEFYKESSINNGVFKNENLKLMSKLTHHFLSCINYETVAQVRTNNFVYLNNKLRGVNKLHLKVPYGAFMYPLYLENGEEVKQKLIQKKIYVPTLWSDVFELADNCSIEYKYAKNIVLLPIDQRYNTDDMEYMMEELKCII